MRINKLTASFGKLNNESIEFHQGLNIISAPNESGKSTWCAFVRTMLYGVESSQRAKAGFLPDKQKYAPWSGAPMEGSMELTFGGKDITLTRTTKSKNAPMREFSAVYTGTGIPVPGLDGANVGEALTGVSRDVFTRSAFIEQGGLTVTGTPELEKRISAIVSTGEEDSSYSEADERLRAWQRKRRYNNRGALPELEASIARGLRAMDEMSGKALRRDELSERVEFLETRCTELESRVTESRKKCRRDALESLSKSRAELTGITEEYEEAAARSRADEAALNRSALGAKDPQTVKAESAEDIERARALAAQVKAKPSSLIGLACVFLLLLSVAAGIFLTPLAYIGLAVFGGLGAYFIISYNKKMAAFEAARADLAELLQKYSAGSAGEISMAVEEYLSLAAAAEESASRASAAKKRLESAKKAQAEIEAGALENLDFSNGSTEAARLGRELAAARAEREGLLGELSRLEGSMQALGDPLVIKSEIQDLQTRKEALSRELEAIILAVDTLREADGEIQSRFSPRLGELAAEYMSAMTGGKYTSVMINRDFTARAGTTEDAVSREAQYLSGGTLDLMYLAVRLAVCVLALPEGEKCPIILDDALVNLDPEREAQAMELLKKLAGERQIILFSCR